MSGVAQLCGRFGAQAGLGLAKPRIEARLGVLLDETAKDADKRLGGVIM
jgi:hypothetical protein